MLQLVIQGVSLADKAGKQQSGIRTAFRVSIPTPVLRFWVRAHDPGRHQSTRQPCTKSQNEDQCKPGSPGPIKKCLYPYLGTDTKLRQEKLYIHRTRNNNNNNRRLVTLAEHTSDHGRQTNSSTEEKGEQV